MRISKLWKARRKFMRRPFSVYVFGDQFHQRPRQPSANVRRLRGDRLGWLGFQLVHAVGPSGARVGSSQFLLTLASNDLAEAEKAEAEQDSRQWVHFEWLKQLKQRWVTWQGFSRLFINSDEKWFLPQKNINTCRKVRCLHFIFFLSTCDSSVCQKSLLKSF